MTNEIESFVFRAIVERAASVLLAAPEHVGQRLLLGWVDGVCLTHAIHAIALVEGPAPTEANPAYLAMFTAMACDDTRSPDAALRSALRFDPDVIICERGASPKTELLLTCALTGHQVLAHLPESLESLEPQPMLGAAIHLGVEADAEGILRLIRFASAEQPREVLWDRTQPGPLPSELPGRPLPGPPSYAAPEPLPASIIEAARAAGADRQLPTWLPLLAEPSGDASCSKLGGRPMLAPGEAWPACPTCAQPLPLALQLSRRELPEAPSACFPAGAGWLQLFYCDSDSCTCENPASPEARNRLLRWLPLEGAIPAPPRREVERSWTPADLCGWEERREGPHPEDLPGESEADEEAEEALLEVRDQRSARDLARSSGTRLYPECVDDEEFEALAGARQGDKLCGWPDWEQGAEWTACPRCAARRELVFQLDAASGRLTSLFAADGRGHVLACPAHPEELSFAWACG